MDIFEHQIQVEKTARYFVANPTQAVGRIWALHGYGQLPAYFLRRFQPVVDLGWQVVAPEGLHRFYLDGTSGRVGASWMTKESRETDMADYVGYLDRLHDALGSVPGPSVLLGFSQGVATAARWAAKGRSTFDAHLFWAGVFPPDLEQKQELSNVGAAPVYLVLGDQDPYFNEEVIRATEKVLESHGIAHRVVRFNGAHEVDGQVLSKLISSIRNRFPI